MDNALYYLALNRQVGLSAEMTAIANNIANMGTAGYRREGVAFSEFVVAAENWESVSMADAGARFASSRPGGTRLTGGAFDLAIQGKGYFVLQTDAGRVLTRAGAFQLSDEGVLVTPDGNPVLSTGEAPIVVPPGAGAIQIAPDGTVSAGGAPLAQILVADANPSIMRRSGNTAFTVDGNAFTPVEGPRILQGALERSNVDPVAEIARMSEVSRAYEMTQSLIKDEDDRIRDTLRTLGERV